jgi:NAD(P)H-hydrate epimerase
MEIKALTREYLTAALPARRRDSSKGDYGRALLICGSVGYTGAPFLAAEAAVRSGAGLVFLGVPGEIYEITAMKLNEAMPFPLPSWDGMLSERAVDEILRRLERCNVCLIGPGLGRSQGVSEVVFEVIKNCRVPLVIDADGINAVSANINILDEAACPIILTPHEGEFKRLGGDLSTGREKAALEFARARLCTLILKGSATVIAFEDGTVLRNTTGNPGMAKGGSGDVLSGVITALLGQKLSLERAVSAAVWLHGRAGDLLKEELGEYSMTPTDLVYALPRAFKELLAV